MIASPTREQRLLMNLARASSAGKQSRQLEQWFDGLDNAAWLIELMRVHIRLTSGVAQPHGVFALTLQLRAGRNYRVLVVIDDEIRSTLVNLARVTLKFDGEQILQKMYRTPEFQRFQRALEFNTGANKPGRKLEESFYASEGAGSLIESLRLRSHLRIKEWAVRIGTSENTYRKRLDEGVVPPIWIERAQDIVKTVEDSILSLRAGDHGVTMEELSFAFGRVWAAYVATTDKLHGQAIPHVPESVDEKAAREAREDEELLRFVPSAEEDLDIDVGTIDDSERVQPIDQDETRGEQ